MVDEMKASFYTGSLASLKEFWKERGRTGSFERGYHIRMEGVSSIVERVSRFIDGKLVLDIGCGPGIVASFFPQSTSVVGFDFSTSMLRGAKGRVKQLVRGSAHQLPFREGAFEVATCFFVASDYSLKKDILSEAYRVLEDDGLLLFADYSPNDEHWTLKRRIRPLLGESCDIFIESEKSLKRKLERCGFEVQKAELIRFSPQFELGSYLRSEKEMEKLAQTEPSLWQVVQGRLNEGTIRREFILLINKKAVRQV